MWRHHLCHLHIRKRQYFKSKKDISKCYSCVFWKAFQISRNYFSCHTLKMSSWCRVILQLTGHTRRINHSSLRLFNQRQKGLSDVNHSPQIDVCDVLHMFQRCPFYWRKGKNSGIIHQSPQAWNLFKWKVNIVICTLKFCCITEAPFSRVRRNFVRILYWQKLARFHLTFTWDRRNWTGIFERLSVQVWDLKKAGPKLAHLAVQKSVQLHRFRVNASWNRASFCLYKNLSGPV